VTRLPVVSAAQLEDLLLGLGFTKKRVTGGHAIYVHADGRYTVVPRHGGKTLNRPLVRAILRQIELAPEDYVRILRDC